MAIDICYAPTDLLESLSDANATQPGMCFENCLIAVLGLRTRNLQYALGFLTPPGYERVRHAWLLAETTSGPVYLDPTLQVSSPHWKVRRQDFIYDRRYTFTRALLLSWFREQYPDRQLTSLGIPEGPLRGPMISSSGELE